ncbi:MAG: hypothetical protein GVY22_19285 [Gammaproteobacteria bacterium]|jgi:3-dehydroquinate dehydratase|nr:hypothetical protein [Gammaproteobacteria bacterium]
MNTRAAATVLASALTLSAMGATAATSGSIAPTDALSAYSESTLSASLAQGNLEQHLTTALETAPSQEQLLVLQKALASMGSTAPADAAAASQSLVNSAWTTAASNPQLGIDLAAIAVAVAGNPAVIDAAPETAAQALADVNGIVTLAQHAAEGLGITLSGTDVADKAQQLAAANASLQAAVSDFETRVADAIELASAQAELTDFSTAAFSIPNGGGFSFPPGFTLRSVPVASPATPSFGFNF